ncbi:VTT domain-containing protein [Legionella maioricensis]|uniref:VTT domain-containing protein n=1 Tax=Legionella maioricensis TaxID=2896528 RepID=A0A9X2D213_9GAMM|nr:VTT domain-containing protein [Legionella maioricensis]MCL9684973.1 VTT domain-containing protein [Legionella maioricensis]MCL9688130.1 VTT domain-containing protein [Legionella maioricensis]
MNLFADYVQPLTDWLQTNPRWSLFITFFIALTESLAIIGSIIPGSVTMTAIGILAGSGIMRLDLTLLAATLGAICGDSLSYALGYFYSERLIEVWPFKKYPHWLKYGEEFFARHGGKSVLLGRFIGPLRSLIPVIAGILRMKQWRFLLANVLSAIGWSLLYVMPGALIGAASHGLSAESATRLFLLILIILAVIWLISLFLKWLFLKLSSFFKNNLHHFWLSLKHHPLLGKLYNAITPEEEPNHFPTAALLLLCLLSSLFFIILAVLSSKTQWLNCFNIPVHLIVQSFHTPLLEAFFIICTQLTSTFTITSLYIICCLWFLYHKHLKVIPYLTSLIISSYFIAFLLAFFINSPRPQGLQVTMSGSSFASNLEIGTAFYIFILFYINNKYTLLTNSLRTFILVVLGLSGVGTVYLGDVWPTDILIAYFAGVTVCLIHYLIYRKSNLNYLKTTQSATILLSLLAGILFSTALSTYLNFKALSYNHTPYRKEYTLSESVWWNQQKPLLPIYRLNRIGNRMSLLNIQYVGELDVLQSSLEQNGWETHAESFVTKLLMKMNTSSNKITFPLLAQLYENKPPELIMTYKDSHSPLILELYIWESNYNIVELNKPLLIGALHSNRHENGKKDHQPSSQLINPLTYIMPALSQFTLRRVELPKSMINSTLFPTTPMILLIKDPETKN